MGDKVIDHDRLVNNEGEIIGFTFDHTDPDEEKIDSVSVRYTMSNTGVVWYTMNQFSPHLWTGDHWDIGEEKEDETLQE